jgi:hypothetical protein
MTDNLEPGEIVYVRMEFRRKIAGTESAQCYVRDPDLHGFTSVPIPMSQIVCREPRAMEADNGIVKGIR